MNAKGRPVSNSIPAAARNVESRPTTRLVPASELAQLPVHPLSDHFTYLMPDRLEELAIRLSRRQGRPVVVCRDYVLDGRDSIAAGIIANLDLRVEDRDELNEYEIQELVFALNPHRLNLPRKKRIELAVSYYDVVKHTEHALTLQRVADLFHLSKRSLCRYRKNNA